VRENIGAGIFGEKYKRSGGKALDFYSSQVMWLANMGMLKRTINKVERPYGFKLKGVVKKNKVGIAFREAEFNFEFGYGTNDFLASLEFLNKIGRLDAFDLKTTEYKDYLKDMAAMSDKEYFEERARAAKAVKVVWDEVETAFLPTRRKYA
jgi:RecA/RadA recombinase